MAFHRPLVVAGSCVRGSGGRPNPLTRSVAVLVATMSLQPVLVLREIPSNLVVQLVNGYGDSSEIDRVPRILANLLPGSK